MGISVSKTEQNRRKTRRQKKERETGSVEEERERKKERKKILKSDREGKRDNICRMIGMNQKDRDEKIWNTENRKIEFVGGQENFRYFLGRLRKVQKDFFQIQFLCEKDFLQRKKKDEKN